MFTQRLHVEELQMEDEDFDGTVAYARAKRAQVILTRALRGAWGYPDPSPGFEQLRDTVAFYPAAMGQFTVEGELVRAQPGGFYGGWITSEITGPFKGAPGTMGW